MHNILFGSIVNENINHQVSQHVKHRVLMDNREYVLCSQTGCRNSGVSDCLNALNLDTIKENINIILNEQNN